MCASKSSSSSCNSSSHRSVIFPSVSRFLSTQLLPRGEDGSGGVWIRFSGCFVFSSTLARINQLSFFFPSRLFNDQRASRRRASAVVYLRPRTKAARNLRVAHTFPVFSFPSDVILLSVEIHDTTRETSFQISTLWYYTLFSRSSQGLRFFSTRRVESKWTLYKLEDSNFSLDEKSSKERRISTIGICLREERFTRE